jgi:hypothetical protein
MAIFCKHLALIRDVLPSALGCEKCLKLGDPFCRSCGNVGCCDQSPNRHAIIGNVDPFIVDADTVMAAFPFPNPATQTQVPR